MPTIRELAEIAQTKGELAKTFDYALPQQWVDMVHERLGVWPQVYGFVWEYPEKGPGRTWGRAAPLTGEAKVILTILEHLEKQDE
jgi:hypothetical protein